MLRRLFRLAALGLAAGVLALTPVNPAHASDTWYLSIHWIRCDDESEPFSDEIRLKFNNLIVGGWNDVDHGETHWYYSSQWGTPLNIPFPAGTTPSINFMEEDGGNLNQIGWVNTLTSEVDQGLREKAKMGPNWEGRYAVYYQIRSSP